MSASIWFNNLFPIFLLLFLLESGHSLYLVATVDVLQIATALFISWLVHVLRLVYTAIL
jgi:hypothetical protein